MTDWIKGRIEKGHRADIAAGVTLLFLSGLFFADLFGGRYLLTERDLGPYFIPPRFFWVESLKNLDFPLWNPYQFCGSPLIANPQHGLLYPLNVLLILLPFDIAFNGIIILHLFLGGLFTYVLLRDLEVNPWSSLVSGLIFMLSGFLLSVHSLLSCLLSVVWTPLIMLYFRRALMDVRSRYRIYTALFMTFSFLGGGVEIVYGNFFLLLLMSLVWPFSVESSENDPGAMEKGRRIFKRIASFFWVGLLFLTFSSIQLIPFAEIFFHSIRKGGLSYGEATVWSFAPKDILLFFLPDAYGYFVDIKKYWISQCWFKTLYTGGFPFLLSLIFFLFGRRRTFFIAVVALSFSLALGRYNPAYPWLFHFVPFLNGIRYPAKFLYLFILVLAITAGLGSQRLEEMTREDVPILLKRLSLGLSLLCGFLLIVLILAQEEVASFFKGIGFDFPDFNALSVNLHHAKRLLFYMAIFFLLVRVGFETKWRAWVKVLLVLFLVGDLFGNMGFFGMEKTEDFFRRTAILDRIKADPTAFRVFATRKTIAMDAPLLIGNASPLEMIKEKHLPSFNLVHRIHDIWGVDVIRLKRSDELYRAFTETPSIDTTRLIDLYGIKYVVSVTPLDEIADFERIDSRFKGLAGREEELVKSDTVKLYRYRKAFPRAWLVRKVHVLDPVTMLSRMREGGFEPGKEVFLEEEPPKGWSSYAQDGEVKEGSVQVISESNNRVELRVKTHAPSFLVLSDTYYPGWKVFVNGEAQRLYRADYTFRGVALSAGEHRVVFLYRPLSLKVGAAITFCALFACILWVRRSKRLVHG